MDKLLVAGIDTVLGANLAAWLASRWHVVGLSWSEPLSIAGCETAVCDPGAADSARQWLASERPQWVVYCGVGANSCWNIPPLPAPRPDAVAAAGCWARAAAVPDPVRSPLDDRGVARLRARVAHRAIARRSR